MTFGSTDPPQILKASGRSLKSFLLQPPYLFLATLGISLKSEHRQKSSFQEGYPGFGEWMEGSGGGRSQRKRSLWVILTSSVQGEKPVGEKWKNGTQQFFLVLWSFLFSLRINPKPF